jgi:hypothetical protein
MRTLITMPHFFRGTVEAATNRSTQIGARDERLRALVAAISSLHQALGGSSYGLDHGKRTAWPMTPPRPHALDIVVVTAGDAHLVAELAPLQRMFRHHRTDADPLMLGFECHKLMREARGRYDYYGYVEDDIVLATRPRRCRRSPSSMSTIGSIRVSRRATRTSAKRRGSSWPFSTIKSASNAPPIPRPAASS